MATHRFFRFAYWHVAVAFVVALLLLLSWGSHDGAQKVPEVSSDVLGALEMSAEIQEAESQSFADFDEPAIAEPVTADNEPVADPMKLCSPHGFQPYTDSRKVFDLFLMANELDFLEIRLNSLNKVVDYFIIVTAATTFTGFPQPQYLRDNWDRYKDFHHKMVHHTVDERFDEAWEHEHYMRNALLSAAHLGDVKPELGDVILVSDLDEIPRPEIVSMLRQCDYPERVNLHTRFFYYAYQWLHPMQWYHPQATTYKGFETILPETLRMGNGNFESADIYDAGWHCSSCFKTIKQVIDKLQAFSHAPEWNTPENRDPATIVHRFQNGLDLYGRPEEIYSKADTEDVPSYVAQHRERFMYLLDRTSEYAEFEDGREYLEGNKVV